MAINETISKGNKYRRLKDATNKLWQRISFWTAASDVEFDNGQTAQDALGNITGITDSLTSNSSAVAASANAVSQLNSKLTSFQTGVDALYNKLVALGVTPTDNSLSAIISSIQTVNDNAYNSGYSTGYNTGVANSKKTLTVNTGLYLANEGVYSTTTINGKRIVRCGPFDDYRTGNTHDASATITV